MGHVLNRMAHLEDVAVPIIRGNAAGGVQARRESQDFWTGEGFCRAW